MAGNVEVVCGFDPALGAGSLTKATLIDVMTTAGHIGGSVANQSVHSIRNIFHPKTKEVLGVRVISPPDIAVAVKATMATVLGCTVDVILPTPKLALDVTAMDGTNWTATGGASMNVTLTAAGDLLSSPDVTLGSVLYQGGSPGAFVDGAENDVILAPYLYIVLQSFASSGTTFTIPATPKTNFTVDGKTFNMELNNDILCSVVGAAYAQVLYLDVDGKVYITTRVGDLLPNISFRSFRDAVVANPNGI